MSICLSALDSLSFFFFNDTATTEIYTLSLHDALPIFTTPPSSAAQSGAPFAQQPVLQIQDANGNPVSTQGVSVTRSEEHTSELQSPCNLVCRLLLEKKKRDITGVERNRESGDLALGAR